MQLPIKTKEKAILLRKRGFSLQEISDLLHIAKSTASLWSSSITLSYTAIKRLEGRKIVGQYKTMLIRKRKRTILKETLDKHSGNIMNNIKLDKDAAKLLCAVMYHCEGVKTNDTNVTFINSDPTLIQSFLILFRMAFKIHESKFRILMHLHTYHDEQKQKVFWSQTTNISKNQFMKTYRKPNTAKRIREHYPGCISIRYYDAMVAKQLHSLYRVFTRKIVQYSLH